VADISAALEEVRILSPELVAGYRDFLTDVAESEPERRLAIALNRFTVVAGLDDLVRLVGEFPEVQGTRARDAVALAVEEAPTAEARRFAAARLELLETAAKGDFAAGWERYEETLSTIWELHIAPRAESLPATVMELEQAGDLTNALSAAEELRELAQLCGVTPLEGWAALRVGIILMKLARPEQHDCAVHHFGRAITLLESDPVANAEPLASAHMNLGVALGSRLRGDPQANQLRAIESYRRTLELVSMDIDGGLWAMTHTNLGLSLLNLALEIEPGFRPSRDEQVRRQNALVDEAIDHFSAALEWRSFERDPDDWAYTQINLGLAYRRYADGDERANLDRAIEHYREAERGFLTSQNTVRRAGALHNLAAAELGLARLEPTSTADCRRLLSEAEAHVRLAVDLFRAAGLPLDTGRALSLLGDVLRANGSAAAAAAAYREALAILDPAQVPRDCGQAARALADLATESGEWDAAAEAWEVAALGAIAALEARATSQGRFAELGKTVNVFRWASYALAKVDKLERAVEILEMGRARELAYSLHGDVIDVERLRILSPALCTQLLDLRSRSGRVEDHGWAGDTVVPDDTWRTAESLRDTIASIRALPGFEHLLEQPTFAEVVESVDDNEAFVYVVSSPEGSMALVVGPVVDGRAVQLLDAPAVTSTEIVRHFIDVDLTTGELTGYLAAHFEGDEMALTNWLNELGELLGPQLLQPIAEKLSHDGVARACLAPTGLLGLLPLHALAWPDTNGRRTCLLDKLDAVFVPSAFVYKVAKDRARRGASSRRWLIVGNPLPHSQPLPNAAKEARMVAEVFPDDTTEVLLETAATKEAILERLPGCTHVHFACHGMAGVLDEPFSAGLSLADEAVLTARDLVRIPDFSPRLVVASACETAVIQGYETADEVLSLGTMFLGAGAAGVVATLWAVDDYATALMMSRFYEFLSEANGEFAEPDPAAALRKAQLWLRDLTTEEEEAYLKDRPALRSQRDARKRAPGSYLTSDPFAAMTVWAPFTLTGI
jgi:CHAT domain-containing protein/tetratricopeptide (TPR) repeat protein